MSYPRRIQYVSTRSGIGPALVPEPPQRFALGVAWYAPKPAWMTHVPGPRLRFGSRHAFVRYISR